MEQDQFEFQIVVRSKKGKMRENVMIKIGQIVNYSFFSNVSFEGFDNEDQTLVLLKDKNGEIKKVYRQLFEKHVSLI